MEGFEFQHDLVTPSLDRQATCLSMFFRLPGPERETERRAAGVSSQIRAVWIRITKESRFSLLRPYLAIFQDYQLPKLPKSGLSFILLLDYQLPISRNVTGNLDYQLLIFSPALSQMLI